MTDGHQDYEPLFDADTQRRVTALLDSGLPRELAKTLLTTGSVATTRPGGRLTASLSRWEGVLRWTVQGSAAGVMAWSRWGDGGATRLRTSVRRSNSAWQPS